MNQADQDHVHEHKLNPVPTLKIPDIEIIYDPINETESETNPPIQKKQKLNKNLSYIKTHRKKITISGIVILGLILSVVLFLKLHKDKVLPVSYNIPSFDSLAYSEAGSKGEDKGILFTSDGQVKVIDPCVVKSFNVLNNILLTQIESDCDNYYILTKTGYKKAIPIDCLNYIISGNGRYIYYLKHISYEGIELYRYDHREDTTKLLAKEKWISGVVVSPDGESYTARIKDSDGMERTYLWAKQKKQLLGENINVFAISDHGSYIYYTNEIKEKLCKFGDKTTRLAGNTEKNSSLQKRMFFNYSQTEVIISDSETGSYFMKDGQKPVKISNDMIMEYVASTFDHKVGYLDVMDSDNRMGMRTYPVDAFENRIFRTERGYVQIQEQGEGQFICGISNVLTVSDDYSKVMFHNTTNSTITVKEISALDNERTKVFKIPRSISDTLWLDDMIYCLLPDGRVNGYNIDTDQSFMDILTDVSDWAEDAANHCFYYTNTENEVFCVKNSIEIKHIKELKSSYFFEYCGNHYAVTADEEQGKVYLLRGSEAVYELTIDA